MKRILFSVLAVTLFACSPTPKPLTGITEKAEVTNLSAGGDKDEHGCLAAAGYTWSVLKNDCIRAFEQHKLMPTEQEGTAVLAAFFLFNANETKAELFLPNEKKGTVLQRSGTEGNYVWKKDDLELFSWKGYVLKKSGKTIFHGQ